MATYTNGGLDLLDDPVTTIPSETNGMTDTAGHLDIENVTQSDDATDACCVRMTNHNKHNNMGMTEPHINGEREINGIREEERRLNRRLERSPEVSGATGPRPVEFGATAYSKPSSRPDSFRRRRPASDTVVLSASVDVESNGVLEGATGTSRIDGSSGTNNVQCDTIPAETKVVLNIPSHVKLPSRSPTGSKKTSPPPAYRRHDPHLTLNNLPSYSGSHLYYPQRSPNYQRSPRYSPGSHPGTPASPQYSPHLSSPHNRPVSSPAMCHLTTCTTSSPKPSRSSMIDYLPSYEEAVGLVPPRTPRSPHASPGGASAASGTSLGVTGASHSASTEERQQTSTPVTKSPAPTR